MTITNEEILKVIKSMNDYGGSFVTALAGALRVADYKNVQKIKKAFPKEWEQYLKM